MAPGTNTPSHRSLIARLESLGAWCWRALASFGAGPLCPPFAPASHTVVVPVALPFCVRSLRVAERAKLTAAAQSFHPAAPRCIALFVATSIVLRANSFTPTTQGDMRMHAHGMTMTVRWSTRPPALGRHAIQHAAANGMRTMRMRNTHHDEDTTITTRSHSCTWMQPWIDLRF